MNLQTQQPLCLSYFKKYCLLFLIAWLTSLSNSSAQSISEFEYFFGTDPGIGNGTMISANTNTGDLTQSFSLSLAGLDEGFQQLTFRALDDQNKWSLYKRMTFYITEESGSISPLANIIEAEYWIDNDPGLGDATALTISGTPNEVTESYLIPLDNLEEGFHSIGIRVQNTDGIWSLYNKRTFFVFEEIINNPISNIAGAEYWFDMDPGFGNGTALPINGSPIETTESYVIPLGNLEPGFHKLGLRIQNLDGTWSLYDKRVFYIFDSEEFNVSPISEMEFLYDSELGFGTGETVPVTATGNPDEYLVEIPTDLVTCDLHDLWISLKNENGDYSLYNILVDVDVFDNQDPTIMVNSNITVALDALGQGTLTINDVDNGTFDDCELVSVVLDQNQFNYDCNDLGTQTVTVTATDAESKISTLDVDISVVDNINPVANAKNISVQLGGDGTVSITANQLENGSTDNCSIASRSVNISNFNCSNIGDNLVSYTVTDTYGNTDTVQAIVTVEDITEPIASAQNITIALDANGQASIVPDDLDLSTDNCGIVSKTIDISNFNCSNLGSNIVTLTVEDQSGNSDNTTAVVTITDNNNPNAIGQNLTVQLNSIGEATITAAQLDNGSTDNCSISNRTIDINSFTCDDIGDNDVLFTVIDQSGNSDSITLTVTVEDSDLPTVSVQDITVQLDANGLVSIDALDIDNGSEDNCLLAISLDITDFNCDDLGSNSVTFTANDGSGNTNNITATVTVVDLLNPTAIGQNITIDLAGQPSISITPDDLDNGSTDNCSFSTSISQDTFNLPGDYPIDLIVEDSSGNTDVVSLIVTVIDTTLGTEDFEIKENAVRLYPNPVQNLLFLETELEISELRIFDITGKTILRKLNPSNQINVNDISEGVYFISLQINNTEIVKRFIRQ